MSDWLDGYDPEGFFDEFVSADGAARPHYRHLRSALDQMGPDRLRQAESARDTAFRSAGITFTVYDDDDERGTERTFPMDLIPRVIPAEEWDMLEGGLIQRVTALNRFLEDLYTGGMQIVNDGVVPRWLVLSSTGFSYEALGVHVPMAARCLVAGVDMIRDAEGTYRVLEDNLRNPSGVSYVIENRSALTRVMPRLFEGQQVRPVDQYGRILLRALQRVAPAAAGDNPTVVVLTPGIFNSAYFEHVFLATQMGVELVEGRDLVVDDHVVHMRTTKGVRRVDVIYRRIDDDFLDPVVFRADSSLGAAGLMAAARAGNVTIANAVGNGVADDKAVYAYVPEMIRYYLGEEPIIPNVDTYLLWDDDQRAEVLGRLDQLVVKPVAEAGGYGLVIGPSATERELEELRAKVEADPRNWIAQEVVPLSRHPCVVGDHLEGRHVDLRPFVLTGDRTEVLPGGLTRVALRKGSLVVNSSQGGGSKDTWVLAADDEQVEADRNVETSSAAASGPVTAQVPVVSIADTTGVPDVTSASGGTA
ncbi:MAG: circularly permuted type 2 ATP-grasp protein [Microthrixaceae bacterium]